MRDETRLAAASAATIRARLITRNHSEPETAAEPETAPEPDSATVQRKEQSPSDSLRGTPLRLRQPNIEPGTGSR